MEKVEKFRTYLQDLRAKGKKNSRREGAPRAYYQGIDKALSLIENEFEKYFPKEVYAKEHLVFLTSLYCSSDKAVCPICRSKMEIRKTRAMDREFMGCPSYPRCTGARSTKGNPTMNEQLVTFLLDKEQENKLSPPTRMQRIIEDT